MHQQASAYTLASTKTMRINKILVALLGVSILASERIDAKINVDLQRRRGRRKLADSKNSLAYADFQLPRVLGVNAVSHGPKKSKAGGGSGGSNKSEGSGKGGRSDKQGDDDDDSDVHRTPSPTRSPFSPDEPTSPTHRPKDPHPTKKSEKSKKTKKPKSEDSKETKGSKLQKSAKTPIHKPTTAPIAAPSADGK